MKTSVFDSLNKVFYLNKLQEILIQNELQLKSLWNIISGSLITIASC